MAWQLELPIGFNGLTERISEPSVKEIVIVMIVARAGWLQDALNISYDISSW